MLFALLFCAIQGYSQFGNTAPAIIGDGFIKENYKFETVKSAYFITTKQDTIECFLDDLMAKNIFKLFANKYTDFIVSRIGKDTKDTIAVNNILEAYIPVIYHDKILNNTFKSYPKAKLVDADITPTDRYLCLRNVMVTDEDKEEKMLLRLMNPTFCEKIQVYENTTASMTSSNGGKRVPNSMYVTYGGKTIKVKRGNYKDVAKEMYKDCPKLMNMKPYLMIYEDMEDHVYINDKNMCN